MVTILQGDCRDVLQGLSPQSVHCCVTSPPYWQLRDYECDGQIGLEATPGEFIDEMVKVFREVWRVLRDDGTLWLNLGDTYSHGKRGCGENGRKMRNPRQSKLGCAKLKSKNMVGIPWRVAFALQSDGWYLRQDIIWHKNSVMPESVKDRPARSHEYIFLLSKSKHYHYDFEAIKEKCSPDTHARYARGRSSTHKHADGGPGNQTIAKTFKHMRNKTAPAGSGIKNNASFDAALKEVVEMRNKRSVWTIPPGSYKGAHFATFPPDLIRPCILAGCPIGGTVLDPFGGSGTTGEVAEMEGRNSVLIELSKEYIQLMEKRTGKS